MTTDRHYRSKLSLDQAIQELKNHAGKQFDGEIVDTFVNLLDNMDSWKSYLDKTFLIES
jgi:HD-GYP domain-containing protein (c-di-GMP phosphodiesterase class II)